MSNSNMDIRKRFEALFTDWEKTIRDPKVRISSRPQDYIDNEPYREMVKLGREALPFIIEKLETGHFLLNQAVMDIAGIDMEEIVDKERLFFLSEQEKSTLLVEWWKSKQQ